MGWFFLSRMLAAAMTLIVLVVLTRVLGAADFGRYNIIMVSGTVAFSGLFAWLCASITRFHSATEFEGKALAMAIGTGLLLAAALLPIGAACLLLLPETLRLSAILVMAFCMAHAVHEIGLAGFRVQVLGRPFAMTALARPTVGVGLALLLVFSGYGYAGALTGMALGAALTGALALWCVGRRSGVAIPGRTALRSFLTFGMPLAIVSSAAMLYTLISQSALAWLTNIEAVGFFAAAQVLALRSIGMPMSTLSSTSAASIFDAFDNRSENEAHGVMERHFSVLMLISVPIVAVLVFANDTVARLIFDETLSGTVARHLPLLAISAFLSGLHGAYYDYAFMISRKTDIQLYIMVGTLAAHVVFTLAFTWAYGPIGTSCAMLATSASRLAASALIGKALRPIPLPSREIKLVALAAAAFAPFAFLADASEAMGFALLWVLVGVLAFLAMLYLTRHAGLHLVMSRVLRRKGF